MYEILDTLKQPRVWTRLITRWWFRRYHGTLCPDEMRDRWALTERTGGLGAVKMILFTLG